jgi:ribose-phosphate pyrophosphokinase
MQIFSGNSNQPLARRIISELSAKLGYSLSIGQIEVGKFSDGEAAIEILENVRGQDVFIIQSLSYPANDSLMELLLIADALRRASARSISAVIPYFGYARQDRRPRSARVPISARLVADLLQTAGIERILTVELHADQIQGFFKIPVDNIYSTKHFADDINKLNLPYLTVVSPDVGGVLRARSLAKQVGDADLVIIDKRRPRANESEVMNVIGDVMGKHCVIVDDIIDTGGTIFKAVQTLYAQGALSVRAYCSHAILSNKHLVLSGFSTSRITELVVTDTIPLRFDVPHIRQLSVADLLAETIKRINNGESIKDLS